MSNNTATFLINKNTIDNVSATFEVDDQVTIYAAGLDTTDVVQIEMVQISDAAPSDPCGCPPGAVVLPGVLDSMVLMCCGEPIQLTREKPFVIVDAPQDQLLRVRLIQANPNQPIDTQRVWLRPTKTRNVNDRLRGCPCGSDQ